MRPRNKPRAIESAVPADVLSCMLQALSPVEVPRETSRRVKRELAARMCAQRTLGDFLTIRAGEAGWRPLAPQIDIRPLVSDGAVHSFLLRLQPGAQLPPHHHFDAEECLVLSGEGRVGEFLLRAGDYHFAPKGSSHGIGATQSGMLLYVRGNCPALD